MKAPSGLTFFISQAAIRIQFEGAHLKGEADLIWETLIRALTTAVVMARASVTVVNQIGDSFEKSGARMARDFTGRE